MFVPSTPTVLPHRKRRKPSRDGDAEDADVTPNKRARRVQSQHTRLVQPFYEMYNLLNFILDHEESFQSKRRLSSLYSDFTPQKDTNPEGYNANLAAWKKAFANATYAGAVNGSRLSIRTGEELGRALMTKQWGRPLALADVIQDAIAKKEMIPLQAFLDAKQSIHQRSWLPSPWQLMSWGLSLGLKQLGLGGSAKMVDGQLVITANVEKASNAILQRLSGASSNVDLIYSMEGFRKDFASIFGSDTPLADEDTSILLTYLSRDKHALTYTNTTIKFKSATARQPEPITSQDSTIAQLKTLIAQITTRLPSLQERISQCDVSAREAVAKKQTAQAKVSLRQKKMVEESYGRLSSTLAQLETTFTAIETAVSNVEIMGVMRSSTSVLKNLNQQVGGAEGVDEVLEALREETSKTEEITNLVSETGTEGVDEDEVDEEFEAMQQAEREKEEKIKIEAEKKKREIEEKKAQEEAEAVRKRFDEAEREAKEKEETVAREKAKDDQQKNAKPELAAEVPEQVHVEGSVETPEKVELNPNSEEWNGPVNGTYRQPTFSPDTESVVSETREDLADMTLSSPAPKKQEGRRMEPLAE